MYHFLLVREGVDFVAPKNKIGIESWKWKRN